MKKLLFIPLLGIIALASSCRTVAPLDPMTMTPSDQCVPGHQASGYSGK